MGDIKLVYDGIGRVTGPTTRQTAPLQSAAGEIFYNKDEQLGKWVDILTTSFKEKVETLKTFPIAFHWVVYYFCISRCFSLFQLREHPTK